MYRMLTVIGIGLVASFMGTPVVSQERNDGQELFTRDLKGWSRSGRGPSPWGVTSAGVVSCEKGVTESLTYNQDLGDGTLTLEWRFVPTNAKTGHTASLTVRGGEGDFACRVDLGENCGGISTTVVSSTDKVKTVSHEAPKDLAKKVGEWNTLKITMKGKEIVVSVNGQIATSLSDCPNDTGSLALNVNGHPIEFRKLVWSEAK